MTSSLSRRTTIVVCGAIALVVAVLTLYRLGASDICSGDEAVEAVFVQQMVEHDELLFPIENGRQPMYKPPLFHWTAAALDWATGTDRVTARNVRAVAALYAIAGVIVTMAVAGALISGEGAILAGLALAGSYQYISLGRFGRVDMTLCFFEALALYAFLWWLPEGKDASARDALDKRLRLYGLAIAMGLAVLSKGPVGALIPGAAIVLFMLYERRMAQMLALLEPGPLLIGAVIASSWYAACYLGGKFGFLNRQMGSENVGRFFGSLGTMAPLYYLKPIFLNSAPLSLIAPIAVALALWPRSKPHEAPGGTGFRPVLSDERRDSAIRLFALFWIVTVVFFNLAAYKRRSYLLPLWPANAMLIAWLILSLARYSWGRTARWAYVAVCTGLVVFNFIYIPRKEVRDCADSSYRPAAEEILQVVGKNEPLYTFGFDEELAPLLFYLDRDAPQLKEKLGDAPPGYVIVPLHVWKEHQGEALDLTPVLTSNHGQRKLVLLRRGKTYAMLEWRMATGAPWDAESGIIETIPTPSR
ncbi:MAG TPA: glycosyltransferase family 39 protein [Candidatus Binataceae bacterium]|nr:glycosyltransferase family 39 protein [Candidatus Binataceae bacterium]